MQAIYSLVEQMQTCDPILDMAISQADLRAMFERNPDLSKVNSGFSVTPSIKEKNVGFLAVEQAPLVLARPIFLTGMTQAKPNKYRNIKVEYDGMKFDSKHELKCWQELKLREKAGEIAELTRQVRFDLEVNALKIGKITVDFTWVENGQLVVADAKSEITRKETAYRIRKRHFEAQYEPLVIREL